MVHLSKQERKKLIIYLAVCMFSAFLRNFHVTPLDFFQTSLYAGVIIHWTISVYGKFADNNVSKHMYRMGIYGIMFMIFRIMKYNCFKNIYPAFLYVWYMYYIPVGMMAYHAFCIALESVNINRKKKETENVFFVVTVFLVLLILSNNIHRKAFYIFEPTNVNSDYIHGPFYYMIIAWTVFLLISAFILLVRNCTVSEIKRFIWIPLFISSIIRTYHILYPFFGIHRERLINFPEAYSIGVLALIESYIQTGLIPSNLDYSGFFSRMKVNSYITDKNLNVILSSDGNNPEKELLLQAVNGEVNTDENHEMHSQKIRAGYVFWEEDHTEINNLNRELEVTNDRLSDFNDVISQENRLKEEKVRIEAKTAIYDRINMSVKPWSDRIKHFIFEMDENDPEFNNKLAYVCVLDAYLKRRSNLEILAADSDFIQSTELYLSMRETCDYLNLAGINARNSIRGRTMIDSGILINLYSFFELVCENNYNSLISIMASVTATIDNTFLRIQCDNKGALVSENAYYYKLIESGCSINVTEEEVTIITIVLPGGALQ